jgi:integrase/recombinase XerD
MPRKGYRKPKGGDAGDPEGFIVWSQRYAEHLKVKAFSPQTLRSVECHLGLFIDWAVVRGLARPSDITKPILESYQRWLFYHRQPNGKPISFAAQHQRLQKVRSFFKWLTKNNVLGSNPASELELPKIPRRLPRAVFSEREVELVLAVPDLTEPLGLRDRAILEIFYSSGVRRFELAGLTVFDIDAERGTLMVRQGKRAIDRVVPVGARALHWVRRYLEEVRPSLALSPDDGSLFLSDEGEPLKLPRLTQMARRYIEAAKLGKSGACHVFRHTMATLMLENGADVRLIQEILGHARLTSTQIYTRISIRHLKSIHDQTHPGAKLEPRAPTQAAAEPVSSLTELLQELAREAGEEDAEDE